MTRHKRHHPGSAAAQGAPRDGHRLRPGLLPWLGLGLAILLVAVTLVLLGLSGRSIPVPHFVVAQIESRANAALAGQAAVTISSADVVVGPEFVPHIRLRSLALISPTGKQLAQIADLRLTLKGGALLRGQLLPSRLTIRGAAIALRRMPNGSLDVAPAAKGFSGKAMRPDDMVKAVERAFDLPALSAIETIDVSGLSILLDDARSGQVWTVRDGTLDLQQDTARIGIEVGFDLAGQAALSAPTAEITPQSQARMASAKLTLLLDKQDHSVDLDAKLVQVSAADLAAQVPALAWLAALDAPISGGFHTGVGADGKLAVLRADLDVGAGALHPTPDTRPIAFDRAHLGLTFDPATAELTLSDLRVDSPSLQAEAVGKAWVKGLEGGAPTALVGQVQLRNLKADPAGLFASPVAISQGALDLKLELAPFRLTIGQLVLIDRGRRISAKGDVTAEAEGWAVALDVAIDAIETDRLLALWPVSAVPNTRKWLQDNVATGELFDVKGALRLRPDQAPRLALGYQFRGAEVRFLKTLPPIQDGAGYASIDDYTYTLAVEKGHVSAPQGGDLDVAGSVLKVPDIRVIPARAEIALKTRSTITAALAILDEPPFGFISKAGQRVDMADGQAVISADLKLPLVKNLKPDGVDYRVTGQLLQVQSSKIVKGRVLSAATLDVTATPKGVDIAGVASLDGAGLTGAWHQVFGPEGKGKSQVKGQVDLSQASLKALSISLPQGAVKGQGRGDFTIDLQRGQPPALHLKSDLLGLTLAIPELSWTKAADQAGTLVVAGSLGAPAAIDQLDLAANNLNAKGKVVFKVDGGLDRVEFSEVTLGDWLKSQITLTGRGKGRAVALSVGGGTVDLRRATFGTASPGTEDSPPMDIALNELRISNDIMLGDFRGNFSPKGGLSGNFTGMVNGQAAILGTMVPAANGRAAFRLESDDAGAVFAAAGLYSSGRGGAMRLVLMPEGDKGTYQGSLNISNIRVVNAPTLAGLLNAVSVVGLINELQGAGIVFSDVFGKFLLTPDAVEIREGSAVGPALGVSAAGVYHSADKSLDLQGVISPVYLLNGVGQIFSHQRDGLFGFNYTLTGTKDATKVSVNPLSILTPGMFRDLFRKDPPKITP